MQLFHTFVIACVTFASSIIANPAVAIPHSTDSNLPDNTVKLTCMNKEKLTHNITNGRVSCIPAYSLGYMSSPDCLKAGGLFYYCIFPGAQMGDCIDAYSAIVGYPLGIQYPYLEDGECFRVPA